MIVIKKEHGIIFNYWLHELYWIDVHQGERAIEYLLDGFHKVYFSEKNWQKMCTVFLDIFEMKYFKLTTMN